MPQIRCREIAAADVEPITDLLARGFPARNREFWARAMARLRDHRTPAGCPKYGYLLENHSGKPLGVLLLICTEIPGATGIRCNVSSWYVDPAYRGYAPMLTALALRRRDITYVNLTPARSTWPILEVQGWKRFCEGRFFALPALAGFRPNVGLSLVGAEQDGRIGALVGEEEAELLRRHASCGCICLVSTIDGGSSPFVFVPVRRYDWVPCAYLAYCRGLDEFVRVAGPLGRFLARRGFLVVELDANGPVAGLVGKYLGNKPKFYKGPEPPSLGDCAYSERVMFGI